MNLPPTALLLIGLLLAAWMVGAGWLMLSAMQKAKKAESSRKAARRLSRMIDEAPAIPLLVRADGRIEAPHRLAGWLGLDSVPDYLSELDAGERGIATAQLAELSDAVRKTQKTAGPFRMVLTPRGSRRSLALRGHLADPLVSPGGAALVWIFDFSDSESELVHLRDESARAREDFAALVGLIEAAPIPMWFREQDGRLRLVNSAYVDAVAGGNADKVVAEQMELVEPVEGHTAADIARKAAERGGTIERVVAATIGGQRRSLRVSDLALGAEGIAGYAIDIEEMEQQGREFRAFREAQRSLIDQLSVGVAQFSATRQLLFANQAFRRIFALDDNLSMDAYDFDRFLLAARDKGRVPQVRDFPAWRKEHGSWFAADGAHEENWPLADSTHLRIVGQPMPDGGLVLLAEDRTEQLALSATRDTLLRTRTATFDSLFESLAVFAPDGRLQLWNRRFLADWGLAEEALAAHPRAEDLLKTIAQRLAKPAQAEAIGDIVRGATLDRKQKAGRVALADGRTLEIAGVPLPDGNGLLTVLDITDAQKAEDALRERNAALVEADSIKTRFLANMSYEFRTPLTTIGGFAELLQAGVAGDLSQQGQEYITAILTSVARLGQQIETVLDLSQSEAGLLPLALESLEIMPLVTSLVRDRERHILQRGLSLNLRGTSANVGRINADPKRLSRAIGHLLDNAIAATPSGGRILMDLIRDKAGVRVVISDNGRGMTQAELGRAMDGYRLTAEGSALERREGLGLPLARQLIEAHGGRLDLTSEKGRGTIATVLLQ